MSVYHQICSFGSEVSIKEYEELFLLLEHISDSWRGGESVKLTVCECFKLYLCIIGIGNTVLPFTNEHNNERTDYKW